MKKVQTEEDAPEIEGAQVKEVTQDMSDSQKENEKEHTKKENHTRWGWFKSRRGKESEKHKDFGQMDVKKEALKDVKTALQEEDWSCKGGRS